MKIYFDFPPGWWVLLAIIYGLYFLIFLSREKHGKDEFKIQIIVGIVTLIIALAIEIVAIYLKVWTYFPGNWPFPLWFGYFGSGLLTFQLVKKIEETLK